MAQANNFKLTVTAELIAAGLQKTKRVGPGKYVACCPAHDDRTPSLSITESGTGKVLVHCFGGCTQNDVIAALIDLGLWKPSPARIKRLKSQSNLDKIRFEQILLATETQRAREGYVHTEFERARIRRAVRFLKKHRGALG